MDPNPELGPHIQLIDFCLPDGHSNISIKKMLWTAPELLNGNKPTPKTDIWAVGVLAYYLLTYGKYPFPGITENMVKNKILRQEPNLVLLGLDEENELSEHVYSFIEKCLKKDP